MRVAFFAVLKLAENGLTKVAAQGMHIAGVHSLINARHVVAFGSLASSVNYVLRQHFRLSVWRRLRHDGRTFRTDEHRGR